MIQDELREIVEYLEYLTKVTAEGKDEIKRMLVNAESGSLFLGRTGAGKTHALHCVVNEKKKKDYYTVDGSLMHEKAVIDPKDVRGVFDELNVELGKYYDAMCQALKKLGYPV